MAKFAERLAYAMRVRQISAAKLSRETGIGRSSISSWVKGRWEAKQDNVYLLARALRVDPAYLTGADVPMDGNIDRPSLETSTYKYLDSNFDKKNASLKEMHIPNEMIGKFAGDKDVFITRATTPSMDRIIPIGSFMAIRRDSSPLSFKDHDIIAFMENDKLFLARYFNDEVNKVIQLTFVSTDPEVTARIIRYENLSDYNFIGKVASYTVIL